MPGMRKVQNPSPLEESCRRASAGQRHAGPRPQPRIDGRLHPARRRRRQRAGRPGPHDEARPSARSTPTSPTTKRPARATGGGTSAATGRRSIDFLARHERPEAGGDPPRRVHHREPRHLGLPRLGDDRGSGEVVHPERDPPPIRPREADGSRAARRTSRGCRWTLPGESLSAELDGLPRRRGQARRCAARRFVLAREGERLEIRGSPPPESRRRRRVAGRSRRPSATA